MVNFLSFVAVIGRIASLRNREQFSKIHRTLLVLVFYRKISFIVRFSMKCKNWKQNWGWVFFHEFNGGKSEILLLPWTSMTKTIQALFHSEIANKSLSALWKSFLVSTGNYWFFDFLWDIFWKWWQMRLIC